MVVSKMKFTIIVPHADKIYSGKFSIPYSYEMEYKLRKELKEKLNLDYIEHYVWFFG